MAPGRLFGLLVAVALALQAYAQLPVVVSHSIEVNITVPPFKVDQDDAYICVSALLPPHPHKLVGIIPHAKQEVVHHILLYGERCGASVEGRLYTLFGRRPGTGPWCLARHQRRVSLCKPHQPLSLSAWTLLTHG